MQLADSIVPWLPQRDRAKGRCVVVLDSSGIHLLADVRKAANRHLTGVLAWLGELGKESSAGIGPERVKGEAMDLSKTNTKECPLRPSVSLREDWDIGGIPPPEVHPQAGGGRRQESKGKGAAYVWHSSC